MERHKLIRIINFLYQEGFKKQEIAQLIGFSAVDIAHIQSERAFRAGRIKLAISVLEEQIPNLLHNKYGQNAKKNLIIM